MLNITLIHKYIYTNNNELYRSLESVDGELYTEMRKDFDHVMKYILETTLENHRDKSEPCCCCCWSLFQSNPSSSTASAASVSPSVVPTNTHTHTHASSYKNLSETLEAITRRKIDALLQNPDNLIDANAIVKLSIEIFLYFLFKM